MTNDRNTYRETAIIYDIIHGATKQPMSDIPFYREYAEAVCGGEKSGEILEIGCGTGRVALSLAKDGFSLTGLDLSQQMLDVFKQNLANETPSHPGLDDRVKLVHSSMADFSLSGKFSLITSPFRAFQSVTAQKDIENTLICVRNHLADDGIFIVNVFNPYADPLDESWCSTETVTGETFDEQTGIRVIHYECREKIDPTNQIIYPYLAYDVTWPDGRTQRLVEHLQLKYYYRHQLQAEVENAGLEVVEEYSWYDKTPSGGREIIMICRRKE